MLPVLALLAGSSATRAEAADQTGDKAAAEALFNEGLALVDAGSWAKGCPKFERSFTLYPSRSTMIRIARCRAHEGKVATAWADYQRALSLDSQDQDADRQRALVAIAASESRAIEPRLPRLRVVIKASPAGVQITCDGRSVTPGVASPMDPGRHDVSVTAKGYRREARSVVLREGETATVELTLTGEVARPTAGWLVPAGVALGAVGMLGLGAGAVTGTASLEIAGAVRNTCGGVHCLSTDTASRRDVSTASTLGDVSTASFIAGGGLAAIGGALLLGHLVSRGGSGPGGGAITGLQMTFGPGAVTLQGRF